MNIITKNLVKDFLEKNELATNGDSSDFEKFSIYSIARKHYASEFDLEDVIVGNGDDTGLDGIVLIANGVVVNSKEEIDDLKAKNHYLDIVWILIQAKTSEHFDAGEVNKFCIGVRDFFLSDIGLKTNNQVAEKKELWSYIFSNYAVALRENPKCYLYYITNGVVNESLADHRAIANTLRSTLENQSLFSQIAFKFCGANEINNLYKESCNNLTCQIYFTSKISFPQIESIISAYVGLLPLKEFRKLIVDEDGNIRNVFEDNIRDFLELSNPVNSKIDETLKGDHSYLFPLLNNGITIVADKLQQTGDWFTLFDYQIVNGCQTSSVLAQNLSNPSLENLSIPIKIIETTNIDTKNSITLATNSQTQVKREQLAALSDFQKTLEEYYSAIDLTPKLFYERRSNQYNNDGSVTKSRIITVQNQIKAFAAMFLRKPHRVTSYYGDLTTNLAAENSDIFNPRHQHFPYCLAGYSLYRLESMFRNGSVNSSNKKFRFFILFGFASAVLKDNLSNINLFCSRTVERDLLELKNILNDQEKTSLLLEEVVQIITSNITNTKETLKQSSTTDTIFQLCKTIDISSYL